MVGRLYERYCHRLHGLLDGTLGEIVKKICYNDASVACCRNGLEASWWSMFRSTIHLVNQTRRVMNQSPRSYAFLRERIVRESPIPDDRIVPESDHETPVTPPPQTSESSIKRNSVKAKRDTQRPITDIIELSDDDSGPSLPAEIINLTDESQSAPEIVEIVRPPLRASRGANARRPVVPARTNSGDPGLSDSEESLPDLSRFAWRGQVRTAASMLPRAAPAEVAESSSVITTTKPQSRSVNTTNYSFTDNQLRPLTRCVACNSGWTTRKSVAKKLQHIRVCQRKNAFSDDTMRLLIQKQLEQDTAAKPWHSTEDDPEREDVDGLLMDQIVRSTFPKHRNRREVAASTILPVDEQHEIFSKRAGHFLSALPDEEDGNAPPTQTLPPSRLGAHTTLQSLSESTDQSVPDHLNTAIQNTVRQLRDDPGQSPSEVNSKGKDKRTPRMTKSIQDKALFSQPHDGGSSMAKPLRPTLTEVTSPTKRLPQKKPTVLHKLEPQEYGASSPPKEFSLLQAVSKAVVSLETGSMPTLAPSPSRRPKSAKTSERSPRKSKHKLDTISDEKFTTLMEMMIKNDQDLWSRVLLYEPLDFAVFLKMAAGDEVATPKLRRRLRDFLDQKAVHFFNGPDLGA